MRLPAAVAQVVLDGAAQGRGGREAGGAGAESSANVPGGRLAANTRGNGASAPHRSHNTRDGGEARVAGQRLYGYRVASAPVGMFIHGAGQVCCSATPRASSSCTVSSEDAAPASRHESGPQPRLRRAAARRDRATAARVLRPPANGIARLAPRRARPEPHRAPLSRYVQASAATRCPGLSTSPSGWACHVCRLKRCWRNGKAGAAGSHWRPSRIASPPSPAIRFRRDAGASLREPNPGPRQRRRTRPAPPQYEPARAGIPAGS